ncbi:type IV toxin-antitoxin system AbiEi family antitoxin domain-containing protein [Faecalibaculum rodentium]|uniref:type IV toxin-antitoxin system AbiEi family antitoxin domain-containing protein n=1 Tax=Faecalibaculum rodentium TaxID=1702221 RepID=UPI0026F0D6B4|nr:hypothetical protein [Faecalibaculum rodentium]
MLKTYEMLKQDLTAYKALDMKIKRMADRREVIKLKKNLYETGSTVSGYLEAAAICTPSYLSFDYALSCHGLIPERAKINTSATCRKRKKKPSGTGSVHIYQDIPLSFFPFEIEICCENERPCLMATPEKAVCDKSAQSSQYAPESICSSARGRLENRSGCIQQTGLFCAQGIVSSI